MRSVFVIFFLGMLFAGSVLAERADRDKPIYLESDRESSVRFYLARGFETRAETTLGGVRCWCLGRGFAGANRDLCDSVREL